MPLGKIGDVVAEIIECEVVYVSLFYPSFSMFRILGLLCTDTTGAGTFLEIE